MMMLPKYPNVEYTLLTKKLRPRRRILMLASKLVATATLLVFLSLAAFQLYKIRSSRVLEQARLKAENGEPSLGLVRRPSAVVPKIPKDFKTIGIVFYGRRSRVEILDCYLKQNLAENGGSLDEVRFVVKTNDEQDLEYLDRLVNTASSYTRFDLPNRDVNFGQTWDIFERGIMYVKIDDDVIFIGNSTIPLLVASKAAHPEHLLISVNGVNNPALSWVHYHLGAIHPYLPDLNPQTTLASNTWRASKLPLWTGDPSLDRREWFDAPFENHRWLPLGPEYTLDGTPVTKTAYDKSGPGWNNWAIAAQEHYSFLENLERDELDRYQFDTWDYMYERLSINMVAIWGDDVVNNRPFPEDDEQYLTVDLPQKLGRHSVMNGKAIASHFAFQAQIPDGKGIAWTDLLSRYKAYADENVCKS